MIGFCDTAMLLTDRAKAFGCKYYLMTLLCFRVSMSVRSNSHSAMNIPAIRREKIYLENMQTAVKIIHKK